MECRYGLEAGQRLGSHLAERHVSNLDDLKRFKAQWKSATGDRTERGAAGSGATSSAANGPLRTYHEPTSQWLRANFLDEGLALCICFWRQGYPFLHRLRVSYFTQTESYLVGRWWL